ncbi:MAG: TIGR04086 family membrane protein [Chloroflexota bacterium]|nr:TIGR04086 family membrane protein [Chloroflexota bacterium]
MTKVSLQSNANHNISSVNSEARDVVDARRAAVKRGLRRAPIFLGASVIVALTFVGVVGIGVMVAISGNNETTVALVQVGIALICSVFGGLIVGFGVGYRGALHGLLSALIAGVVLVIYTLIGMLSTGVSAGWIIVALTIELLVLPGFGALGGFFGERLRNRSHYSNRPR